MELDKHIPLILSLIKAPEKATEQEIETIHDLVKRYPYFQALRVLHLKMLSLTDYHEFVQELPMTAIYAGDRRKLFYYIHPKPELEKGKSKKKLKKLEEDAGHSEQTQEESVAGKELTASIIDVTPNDTATIEIENEAEAVEVASDSIEEVIVSENPEELTREIEATSEVVDDDSTLIDESSAEVETKIPEVETHAADAETDFTEVEASLEKTDKVSELIDEDLTEIIDQITEVDGSLAAEETPFEEAEEDLSQTEISADEAETFAEEADVLVEQVEEPVAVVEEVAEVVASKPEISVAFAEGEENIEEAADGEVLELEEEDGSEEDEHESYSNTHSFTEWLDSLMKPTPAVLHTLNSELFSKEEDEVVQENINPKNKRNWELIEQFIAEYTPAEKPAIPVADEVLVKDLTSSEEKEEKEIVTDTLAQIFMAQKKYDKALSIYEKLSLKYPEKNIYFAGQIKKITELKKNNK